LGRGESPGQGLWRNAREGDPQWLVGAPAGSGEGAIFGTGEGASRSGTASAGAAAPALRIEIPPESGSGSRGGWQGALGAADGSPGETREGTEGFMGPSEAGRTRRSPGGDASSASSLFEGSARPSGGAQASSTFRPRYLAPRAPSAHSPALSASSGHSKASASRFLAAATLSPPQPVPPLKPPSPPQPPRVLLVLASQPPQHASAAARLGSARASPCLSSVPCRRSVSDLTRAPRVFHRRPSRKDRQRVPSSSLPSCSSVGWE